VLFHYGKNMAVFIAEDEQASRVEGAVQQRMSHCGVRRLRSINEAESRREGGTREKPDEWAELN
jgi:hypothetical protein